MLVGNVCDRRMKLPQINKLVYSNAMKNMVKSPFRMDMTNRRCSLTNKVEGVFLCR